jgi:hypothetical protein
MITPTATAYAPHNLHPGGRTRHIRNAAPCTRTYIQYTRAHTRLRMRAAAHRGSWVKVAHVRTLTVFFSVVFRGDTIDGRS